MMTRYSPEALRALLARHMLFREASPALLDGLVKFATVRHFQPNDEIFAKGDAGNALCGVLMGRVCIYTVSAEGEEAILNILEPGEMFGEIALLDGLPRTASARAMKAVDLLQIHRDHFVPFLHDHPELGVAILPVLCGRIRMNVEFIENAVFLNLTARLARRLVALAEVHGKPHPRGVRIAFKLPQQDLAHMVGATRERVNKELAPWRERGLIDVEGGMMVICRPDELKRLAAHEKPLNGAPVNR
jgi:CRP/FNR family transcriptional regulator, cyclic AMP receptor protein